MTDPKQDFQQVLAGATARRSCLLLADHIQKLAMRNHCGMGPKDDEFQKIHQRLDTIEQLFKVASVEQDPDLTREEA